MSPLNVQSETSAGGSGRTSSLDVLGGLSDTVRVLVHIVRDGCVL